MKPTTLHRGIPSLAEILQYAMGRLAYDPSLRDANEIERLAFMEGEIRHWLANIFQTEMHNGDTAQADRLWALIKGGIKNVD